MLKFLKALHGAQAVRLSKPRWSRKNSLKYSIQFCPGIAGGQKLKFSKRVRGLGRFWFECGDHIVPAAWGYGFINSKKAFRPR